MTVDLAAKQAMANLLSAINENETFEGTLHEGAMPSDEGFGTQREPQTITRTAVLDEEGQRMKDLLLLMNESVDETISTAAEPANRQLAEALVTERTHRGARVGSWEIVKHDDNDFDVVHASTGEPIAKSLKIYEAAYALASGLNAGKTLTDEPIRKVLALEQQYAQHLDKAAHYKHMAKKMQEKQEPVRAAIAEDRFDEARGKALDERDRLLRLAGLK